MTLHFSRRSFSSHITYCQVLLIFLYATLTASSVINYLQQGAKVNDNSYSTAVSNTKLLQQILSVYNLNAVIWIPSGTYTLTGGIVASQLANVTIVLDGTLSFAVTSDLWPTNGDGTVQECILLTNINDFTLTGTGQGVLDGQGANWWGSLNSRPRILYIQTSSNVLIEKVLFKNSAYWSFYSENSNGLVIRYSSVSVKWNEDDTTHTQHDLTAYETDGFDVTGQNVHIHDCNIWNQDDCISVKDGSQNMLFERIQCSGLGLSIGSIGGSVVKNITFKDSVLPNTVKGIYIKTRWSDMGPVRPSASISNILYQNITIINPIQFAIWIGTAQQTGQPCSFYYPLPGYTCLMSGYQTLEDITLRNIVIINPATLYGTTIAGVLLGNLSNPAKNVVFDHVVVRYSSKSIPFYVCNNFAGISKGGTTPKPYCFSSQPSRSPTIGPVAAPTMAPSYSLGDLTFNITFEMLGLSCSDATLLAGQQTLLTTVANILQYNAKYFKFRGCSLKFVNSTLTQSSGNMLRAMVSHKQGSLTSGGSSLKSVNYIYTTLHVDIPLVDFPSMTSSELVAYIESQLVHSIQAGIFTNELQKNAGTYGSTSMTSSSVSNDWITGLIVYQYPTPTPTSAATSAANSVALIMDAVIIAVIAIVVAFTCCVAVGLVICCYCTKRRKQLEQDRSRFIAMTDLPNDRPASKTNFLSRSSLHQTKWHGLSQHDTTTLSPIQPTVENVLTFSSQYPTGDTDEKGFYYDLSHASPDRTASNDQVKETLSRKSSFRSTTSTIQSTCNNAQRVVQADESEKLTASPMHDSDN